MRKLAISYALRVITIDLGSRGTEKNKDKCQVLARRTLVEEGLTTY